MARLLALEWDSREARAVCGQTRGGRLVVEQAFALDLPEGGDAAAKSTGDRLAEALKSRGISRCDTLLAVGRSRIELRSLTLPPCPIEELPELVRFQAMQQFATITEEWPIDFVHLTTGDEQSLTVLAAALSPAVVAELAETCGLAGQTPKHLVLRPFAAASLLRRHKTDERCRLIIDLLADEADLTVIAEQQLGFTRTIRLPLGDAARAASLLGEIRRTTVAARNQLGGRQVAETVLCGTEQEHASLRQFLQEKLDHDVVLFDPFAGLELSRDLAAAPPANSGRYAPLLGMLLDEASGRPHAIDFLNPRKKPEAKTPVFRIGLIAGVAAAAALLLIAMPMYFYVRMGWELEQKRAKLGELKQQEESALERVSEQQSIDAWRQGDIVWLDEMHNLSQKFPPDGEGVVTSMFVSVEPKIGGKMTFDASVDDENAKSVLEQRLHDERHEVSGSGASTDSARTEYAWQFKETVTVKPADPQLVNLAPGN